MKKILNKFLLLTILSILLFISCSSLKIKKNLTPNILDVKVKVEEHTTTIRKNKGGFIKWVTKTNRYEVLTGKIKIKVSDKNNCEIKGLVFTCIIHDVYDPPYYLDFLYDLEISNAEAEEGQVEWQIREYKEDNNIIIPFSFMPPDNDFKIKCTLKFDIIEKVKYKTYEIDGVYLDLQPKVTNFYLILTNETICIQPNFKDGIILEVLKKTNYQKLKEIEEKLKKEEEERKRREEIRRKKWANVHIDYYHPVKYITFYDQDSAFFDAKYQSWSRNKIYRFYAQVVRYYDNEYKIIGIGCTTVGSLYGFLCYDKKDLLEIGKWYYFEGKFKSKPVPAFIVKRFKDTLYKHEDLEWAININEEFRKNQSRYIHRNTFAMFIDFCNKKLKGDFPYIYPY